MTVPDLTVKELRALCKKKGKKRYSRLRKNELKALCFDDKVSSKKKPVSKRKKTASKKVSKRKNTWTVAKLKGECRKNKIQGFSKWRKAELIDKCLKKSTETKPSKPMAGVRKVLPPLQALDTLREESKKYLENLPPLKRLVVSAYTFKGDTRVNPDLLKLLKNPKAKIQPDNALFLAHLQSVILNGPHTKGNITLYRGVRGDKTPFFKNLKVGDHVENPNFLSTSWGEHVATQFLNEPDQEGKLLVPYKHSCCILIIEVSPGQKALGLETISEFPSEREVLLPAGTTFKVTKIGMDSGKKVLHLKCVYCDPKYLFNQHPQIKKQIDKAPANKVPYQDLILPKVKKELLMAAEELIMYNYNKKELMKYIKMRGAELNLLDSKEDAILLVYNHFLELWREPYPCSSVENDIRPKEIFVFMKRFLEAVPKAELKKRKKQMVKEAAKEYNFLDKEHKENITDDKDNDSCKDYFDVYKVIYGMVSKI